MSPEDLMASVKNSNLIAFAKIPGIAKQKGKSFYLSLKGFFQSLR
jgi:Holliday junction resolvasome RuvABC DNA-binding subunit